jgi:hypothetical protein
MGVCEFVVFNSSDVGGSEGQQQTLVPGVSGTKHNLHKHTHTHTHTHTHRELYNHRTLGGAAGPIAVCPATECCCRACTSHMSVVWVLQVVEEMVEGGLGGFTDRACWMKLSASLIS